MSTARWYAKKLGGPHEQGLVIDETTGRNVAVAYDAKDAPLLAAAPRLLAALEVARELLRDEGYRAGNNQHIRDIDTAIAEAKGKA